MQSKYFSKSASRFKSSLALTLSLGLVFMPMLATNAHAFEDWGFEATTVQDATGNNSLSNINTPSLTDQRTYGGASLTLNNQTGSASASGDIDIFNSIITTNTAGLNFAGDFSFGIIGGQILADNANPTGFVNTIADSIVNISGSTLSAPNGELRIFGGLGGIYFASAPTQLITKNASYTIRNNEINIDTSIINATKISIHAGIAFDETLSHIVEDNLVRIDNSTLTATEAFEIFGGRAVSTRSTSNDVVSGNTVVLIDTSLINSNMTASGGDIRLVGGQSDSKGIVTDNNVILNNTTLDARGGIQIFGGSSAEGTIEGNSVTMIDGTFTAATGNITIAGGEIQGPASAKDNTVRFAGDVNITAARGDIVIAGASLPSGSTSNGNTLQLDGATVTLVAPTSGRTASVENFENYVFNPSFDQITNNTPMLTTDILALGNDANLSIGVFGGGGVISKGTSFTLVDYADGYTGTFANLNTVILQQGIAVSYDLMTTLSGGNTTSGALTAITTSAPKTQTQAKVPAQTQVASVITLNQGANLLSGAGIANALAMTNATVNGETTAQLSTSWAAFGAFGAGASRYETGSYADINGFNLLTGLAKQNMLASGDLLYGAFFEYGQSSIDTVNNFATHTVNSSGDSEYYGGGIFARFEHTSNAYGEASLRVGTNEINQTSTNYMGFLGTPIGYSTSGLYYGAHLGLGYVLEVNEANSFDFYAKYFFTHQAGDNANIAGNLYEFDDINSHRARLGARYAYLVSEYIKPYVGLAWDYKFDGEAEYSVFNTTASTPTLEGNTGVFEVGMAVAADNIPLFLDFGLEGFVGVREGASATVQLTYEF